MRKIIIYIKLIPCFLISSLLSFAQTDNEIIMRWDVKMIGEAYIWENLICDYAKENGSLYWPEKEKAFQKVLSDYTDSQWADDAELLMAGEKALIDHNLDGAITALREVIKRYPTASTIIDNWDSKRGCHIGEVWLMWAPGLVILNKDRSIRIAFPFDRNSQISLLEKEALTYFDHIEKYPQKTKDVAQFIIAAMLWEIGKADEAISELQKLLAEYPDLSKIRNIDFETAKTEDGYLIGHEPPFDALPIWRIQYSASIFLINLYLHSGRIEEALSICSKLGSECSPDGWYWNINKFIGNIYAKYDKPALAKEQYDISISGINKIFINQDIRMNALLREGNAIVPDNITSWKEEALKPYSVYLIEIERLKNQLIFK